jgi:hypothetical protein
MIYNYVYFHPILLQIEALDNYMYDEKDIDLCSETGCYEYFFNVTKILQNVFPDQTVTYLEEFSDYDIGKYNEPCYMYYFVIQ